MRSAHQLVFASLNFDKGQELSALLKDRDAPISLTLAENIIRNPEKIGFIETHATYLENSLAKARLANHACHFPCLADDSGLEVEALNARPGVRSQRYATAKSGQTQDMANVQKLLEELKGYPTEKRKARFVTTLSLVIEGINIHGSGILEGSIAEVPRGSNGFGYDPIFIPVGETRTLAEMSTGEKNLISHRARALDELLEQIRVNGITFAKP